MPEGTAISVLSVVKCNAYIGTALYDQRGSYTSLYTALARIRSRLRQVASFRSAEIKASFFNYHHFIRSDTKYLIFLRAAIALLVQLPPKVENLNSFYIDNHVIYV